MLPNAIYAGMGKSGSTLLHKLFLRHPDIYVSDKDKEINFFSKHSNWARGVEWYENVFSGYAGERWVVDISPGYHNKTHSVTRMLEVLGKDLRIIFTLRRFTDFAFSRYLHRIRGRMLSGSFLELLEQKSMFYKPLDDQVAEYIDAFGAENVLLMHYEKEFNRDAPTFEERIYEFLGLPTDRKYYESGSDDKVNSGYYPRFVYARDEPYVEEFDGVRYMVPENTLVFCSGRGYRNLCWTTDAEEKAEEAFRLQEGWTTCLGEEEFWYVQKKYTEPLAERLQDRLGIPFEHWFQDQPRKIQYLPAPLPDAYIMDPGVMAKRLHENAAPLPWS